jgi:hypothetical protein
MAQQRARDLRLIFTLGSAFAHTCGFIYLGSVGFACVVCCRVFVLPLSFVSPCIHTRTVTHEWFMLLLCIRDNPIDPPLSGRKRKPSRYSGAMAAANAESARNRRALCLCCRRAWTDGWLLRFERTASEGLKTACEALAFHPRNTSRRAPDVIRGARFPNFSVRRRLYYVESQVWKGAVIGARTPVLCTTP